MSSGSIREKLKHKAIEVVQSANWTLCLLLAFFLNFSSLLLAENQECRNVFFRRGPFATSASAGIYFSPESFETVHLNFDVREQALLNQGEARKQFGFLQRAVNSVRERVERGQQVVKTVLYPASGWDSFTPYQIFKDANLVVGIDVHPFVASLKAQLQPSVEAIDPRHRSYVHYADVDNEDQIAVKLVGRLLMAFPNLRLRRLVAFVSKGEFVRKNIALPLSFSMEVQKHQVNGLIEFDLGPGTEIRRYLHLDMMFPEYVTEKLPSTLSDQLIKQVFLLPIDAILIKGAMGFFRLSLLSNPYSAIRKMLSVLSERKGVLVDGDNNQWPWNQGDLQRQAKGESAISAVEVKDLDDTDHRLGYISARVFSF